MMGYATAPANLARGPELTELRTGDLGRALPDGLIEVVGRRSRFAKVFGLRLDLDEIERHLRAAGMPAACAEADGSLAVIVERRRHVARARRAVADLCEVPVWVVHAARADIPTTESGKTDHRAVGELAAGVMRRVPRRAGGASADDLCELYAGLLGRDEVTPDDSFVGLGADSLSYVELSVRLGERLDRLPRDWHLRTIAELASSTARKPRRGTSTDPSVILRALTIFLIVATHANLLTVVGGAHALLAVAGYNAARFLPRNGLAARRLARTAWRIALPSGLWIGAVALLTSDYRLATALMANGFIGSDDWTLDWQFWFLEAIVWTSLGLAAVIAVPAVRRLEHRNPFAWALALVAVAAVVRFSLVGVEAGATERYTGTIVLWCFALGWAAARARTMVQRGLVTVLALTLTIGFFDDLWRELLVVAGIAVLVWVPPLRLPARLATACGALAAASLSIYLTHWQIYPHLEMEYPLLATLSSIAVGLAYHRLSTPVVDGIERAVVRLGRVRRPRSLAGAARRRSPH
jgi:acyl carrier protein